MLSSFEAALLDRHLRRCASCRGFAASADLQAQLLRSAELEEPVNRVVVPSRRRPAARRGIAGVLTAGVAAAAVALVAFAPSQSANRSASAQARVATRGGAPLLAVFSAQPTASLHIDVPRLRVEPADAADGPVHGLYALPA
jgi:hypothetical protein